MKIARIETLESTTYPNLLWVQVHTDDGLVGLGETFFGPAAVAAYIHETAAPYLLGQDPKAIARHQEVLGKRMMVAAIGAEARGLSALDIALWDLFGQRVNLPVYQCMGGPVRERVRIYNTCAGYGYNTHTGVKPGMAFSQAWGLGGHHGPYEDLVAWQSEGRAGELAQSLLEMGISAMKIWPFDQFADESDGQHITPAQLEQGLAPFRQIRQAVGDRMEIAVELQSRWNLPSAIRIAAALEEVRPM
ncbi:MAG TPA: enolase C-terminal domain-like protein, partial [Candidatus Acidoferrum sp.]|nr:enolase C-terminal domain-like protein [Candidatus Acidoferrum sp.]